jgi:hypothetical protein
VLNLPTRCELVEHLRGALLRSCRLLLLLLL